MENKWASKSLCLLVLVPRLSDIDELHCVEGVVDHFLDIEFLLSLLSVFDRRVCRHVLRQHVRAAVARREHRDVVRSNFCRTLHDLLLGESQERAEYEERRHDGLDRRHRVDRLGRNLAERVSCCERLAVLLFGDLFGGGARRGRSNGPMKGANIRKSIRITFEEAVFGCEKELDLVLKDPCGSCQGTGAKPGTSPETCPKCGGKGQVVYTSQSFFGTVQNVQTCPNCNGSGKIIKEKCPDCSGTGYTSSRKKIKVTIPAGIDNGQSVRIRDKGEPGVNGGPRGDLLVEVNVSHHPIFQRQDVHIFSTVPISFAVAALGGDVRIPTVDGDVIYTVKPGTKTDTKVRLKGKGVPSLRNSQVRGDHYVTLVIQTPERLSAEAKEALRRFDELTGNTLHQNDDAGKGDKGEKKKKKGFMEKMKEAFEE